MGINIVDDDDDDDDNVFATGCYQKVPGGY